MKQLISKYTFTPGGSNVGTVALTDLTTVDLGRLLLIVNNTRNTVLFNLTDTTKTATVSGNVITLAVSTASQSSGDKLSIIYDVQKDDPDYNRPTSINSFTKMFKEDFDAALNTSLWTTTTTGSGTSTGITASQLRISSGTTANATLRVKTTQAFRVPSRVSFSFQLNQRIANVTHGVRMVNAAGDTMSAIEFTGTSATTANYYATRRGNTSIASTAYASLPSTTAAWCIIEMDINAEYIEYINRGVADSNVAAATYPAIMGTRTRSILDPGEDYYLELYVVNGATPPASTTYLALDNLLVQEFQRTEVEIYGGRAMNASVFRATPVTLPAGVQLNSGTAIVGAVGNNGLYYETTATPLAANGTFTGTSRNIVNSFTGQGLTYASAAKEYRFSAMSDVGGTLYLEVSRDSTTWYRVKSAAMAQATGTGMSFYAEIIFRPSWKYARPVYINGAAAQTQFQINEVGMSI